MSTSRRTTRDHRYDIGVLIGMAREERNDSQTKAAAHAGVSQTKWNHWEKHIVLPTVDEMDHIIHTYFPNERTKMAAIYKAAADDWERMGPPVPTRSYNTPGGKPGDPHER